MRYTVSLAHVRYLTLGFWSMAVLLVCAVPAHSGFRYCNNTGIPVQTALGYYSDSESGWITRGWWTFWPDECAHVVSEPTKRYYYVYAESAERLWTWSGDSFQCVLDSVAFRISFKERNCKQSRKFVSIDLGTDYGPGDYTHSLTCDRCKVPEVRYDKTNNRILVYHVIKKAISGVTIYIPVLARLDVKLDEINNVIDAAGSLVINWNNVQSQFGEIAAKAVNKHEECGDRLSLNSISLNPSGTSAELRANVSYARWLCTSMDLPQTTCRDTWIRTDGIKTKGPPACSVECEDTWLYGPFGSKTKGIPACDTTCEDTWIETPGVLTKGVPSCTTRMVTTSTSKNTIVQQGGSLTVAFQPSISNRKDITVAATVTNVHLDGLGQAVANLLRVDLKEKAQSILNSSLDPRLLAQALPPELRDFTELSNVQFYGSTSLWMSAAAHVKITGADAIKLCQRFWPAGKCSAVK